VLKCNAHFRGANRGWNLLAAARVSLLSALLALSLTACQSGAPPEATLTIAIDQQRIRSGEAVTVSWSSSGIAQVRLDGAPVASEGAQTYSTLTTSRTFFLEGSAGAGRTVTRSATVLVDTVQVEGRLVANAVPLTSFAEDWTDIVPGEFLVEFDPTAIVPASVATSSAALSLEPDVRLVRIDAAIIPLNSSSEPSLAESTANARA
jgi:hypothetical protein